MSCFKALPCALALLLGSSCLIPATTETSPLHEELNAGTTSSARSPVCDKAGFQILHRAYFRPQCGGCHSQGGIGPTPFADADVDSSFGAARYFSKGTFLPFVTDNRFCVDCNLKTTDPFYKDISEWLDWKDSCPAVPAGS